MTKAANKHRRHGLLLLAAVAGIALASLLTLDSFLASQDTTMGSYLSAVMLQATGTDGGQVLRVNLHNFQLALYEGGRLVRTAQIAGAGNPGDWTATPTGDFRILSKEKMHVSRLSGVLMPYAMRFYQGYYFHDIPLTPAGAKITTRYSLGCIRLATGLASEVYGWTRIGARVQVYRAQLAKSIGSDTVYLLDAQGNRQPFASERAFTSRGYRWEDIAVVPAAELDALTLGASLY
jgi:hypothetical protein